MHVRMYVYIPHARTHPQAINLTEDIGVGLSRHEPRRVGRRFLEGVPLAHKRRVLLYACQKRGGLSLALPQGANLGIMQVEGLV